MFTIHLFSSFPSFTVSSSKYFVIAGIITP